MSRKVRCKKCGAECCSCTGCNPDSYVNGLCPKCQQDDTKARSKSVFELHFSKAIILRNRVQPVQSNQK